MSRAACASANPRPTSRLPRRSSRHWRGASLPADAVYFGEVSLSGAIRPVAQSAARLKEAAKLGFARAGAPESARGEAGSDSGMALSAIGSLTDLVASIAASGSRARPRLAEKTDDVGSAARYTRGR